MSPIGPKPDLQKSDSPVGFLLFNRLAWGADILLIPVQQFYRDRAFLVTASIPNPRMLKASVPELIWSFAP